MPPAFFDDFLHSDDPDAAGIERVAAQTGRKQFLVFGEGFASDAPHTDIQARRIERYMRDDDGAPLLPGMLNFPLYATAGDVFARGRPTADLGYRVASMMAVHARPHLMVTFLDNHDVERFLAGGTQAGLKQGLLLMTLPGIPTIYYGTEQAFTQPRATMFATGGAAGGHFDTGAPLYRFIQRATALRREHRVFSRGTPAVLADNPAAPGALAYRMDHDGDAAIVVFNSADHDSLLAGLPTGLAPGTVLEGVFGIDATPADIAVDAGGCIHMALPARSGQAWKVTSRTLPAPVVDASLTIETLDGAPGDGDFVVRGSARGASSLQLVVDGDLSHARTVRADADGRWQASVDTNDMVDAAIRHEMVAWSGSPLAASPPGYFHINRDWSVLADVADPAGDDAGPAGCYRYPTDPGWGPNRQLDLRNVRVSGAGGAIKIELRMGKLTELWKPAIGFDHVVFTVFIEVPGKEGGATVMPVQNAPLPAGMRWHYRLRAHGWSNALFSSAGASAGNEGTPVAPAAAIGSDAARNTVSLVLPASALGKLASLSGVKVYVTTWDYDGGYRPLAPVAQAMAFRGGEGATGPLMMDDSAVLTPP